MYSEKLRKFINHVRFYDRLAKIDVIKSLTRPQISIT